MVNSFSLMMRHVNLSYQLIACFFIYLPIFVFTLLIKLTLLLQNKLVFFYHSLLENKLFLLFSVLSRKFHSILVASLSYP